MWLPKILHVTSGKSSQAMDFYNGQPDETRNKIWFEEETKQRRNKKNIDID